MVRGSGDSSVVERRTRDPKVSGSVRVRVPAGLEQVGEFSSPGSTLCADSSFGIRSAPGVNVRPGSLSRAPVTKVQVAGYSQTLIYPTYVVSNSDTVNWCKAVWCT